MNIVSPPVVGFSFSQYYLLVSVSAPLQKKVCEGYLGSIFFSYSSLLDFDTRIPLVLEHNFGDLPFCFLKSMCRALITYYFLYDVKDVNDY